MQTASAQTKSNCLKNKKQATEMNKRREILTTRSNYTRLYTKETKPTTEKTTKEQPQIQTRNLSQAKLFLLQTPDPLLTWLCVTSGIASKLSAATVSNIMAAEPGVMLLSSSNEKLTSFLRRGSSEVADTSDPVVDMSHSWDKGLLVKCRRLASTYTHTDTRPR